MCKKLLTLLTVLCLLAGCLTTVALAAGDENSLVPIFEEDFEEYEKGVNVSSTLMPNFFVCDANAIGDGVIHVQESDSGNLYLKSHVFTQVYSATPLVGAYEFSLDIHNAQGKAQTGVFIRAPKTAAAYYEADGHPDTSVCQAGLFLYTASDKLGVNVKTYDASASSTAYLQNHTVNFPLPEGAAYPYSLRVTDSGSEIALYVNDTLICRITFAEPGKVYGSHESEGKFFGVAKLYDAQGNEMAAYTDPLLSSDASYIGWTTRSADMIVDNVRVLVNQSYRALLAISKLPSSVTNKNLESVRELVEEARALYDALSEEEKALVGNYGKLTKAESSIEALEAATTEAPTEAPTEPVTQPEEETPAPTDTQEIDTQATDTRAPAEAVTGEPSTEGLTNGGDEPEVKVMDDSLAIWILIAVMIVAVCGTAGYITVKVRK